ncbi:uncharacterized protein PV09_05105 [Verruconis gallopava]|uniref:Peroxin 11C n=1 Tax=Verruconis gallopava TaxID=253628 RepID=A0A0D2AB20_9PEZI|nr:uncharacterized protein PV09_05105 [Verruconis gallopava]KIW03805.1 hypothetical protein PV09_05105 [Verruconis gallopava]
MSSTASLDHLARTSFPSTLPTATVSPVDEHPPPFPAGSDEPARPSTISLALAESDRFVTRVLKVLATPGGTDRVLCTTAYTLQLLSAIINSRLDAATERLARNLAEKASKALLPGETVVATFEPPAIAQLLARLANSSKKLATLISDYRIFVRLWGLLGIYAWGKSVWLDPPKDKVLRWIAYAQVLVNVCFQPLENRAYLAGKTIIDRDARAQLRDWCWSSRFWCASTTLEFVRLWRQKKIWEAEDRAAASKEKRQGPENTQADEEAKAARQEEERLWWKDLIVNAAYYPMTLHWSLETGLLTDMQVGILGMIAGGMGLREAWRKTA